MAVSNAAKPMQKRIRAALIASSQEHPLLAFASLDGALEAAKDTAGELATRMLATFGCTACRTRFIAEKGTQPFCVTCGSEKVTSGTALGNQKRFTASIKDDNLISVQCANKRCNASMILSSAMTTGNAYQHLNCITCGTSMDEVIDEKSEKGNLADDTNVGHGGFEAKEGPALSIEADADGPDASEKADVEGSPLTPGGLKAKDAPPLSIEADVDGGAGALDDGNDVFDIPDDEDGVVVDEEDDLLDDDPGSFDDPTTVAGEVDTSEGDPFDDRTDIDEVTATDEEGDALADSDGDEALADSGEDEGGEDDVEVIGDAAPAEEEDNTPDAAGEEGGEGALTDDEQELIDNAFSTASRRVSVAKFTSGTPIADVLGMNDEGAGVALVSMAGGKGEGKYVAAIKDSVIVARLAPQHAGKNRSSMHTDGFRAVFAQLAKREGMRATLESFGFRPVRVQVLSEVDVRKQVASATKKTEATITAYKEAMAESVALAAVGIDRGQWKGASNPLTAAVQMALTEYGVSDADARRVARKAVTSATQEYVKTLLAQTDKVQSMTREQRKMLADTFDVTNAPASDDDDADESFGDGDEDIVASFGSPMQTSDKKVTRLMASARRGRLSANDAQGVMNVLDSTQSLFGG